MRSSVHLRLPRKPAGGPILPPASWAPRSEAAGALLRRVSFATWSGSEPSARRQQCAPRRLLAGPGVGGKPFLSRSSSPLRARPWAVLGRQPRYLGRATALHWTSRRSEVDASPSRRRKSPGKKRYGQKSSSRTDGHCLKNCPSQGSIVRYRKGDAVQILPGGGPKGSKKHALTTGKAKVPVSMSKRNPTQLFQPPYHVCDRGTFDIRQPPCFVGISSISGLVKSAPTPFPNTSKVHCQPFENCSIQLVTVPLPLRSGSSRSPPSRFDSTTIQETAQYLQTNLAHASLTPSSLLPTAPSGVEGCGGPCSSTRVSNTFCCCDSGSLSSSFPEERGVSGNDRGSRSESNYDKHAGSSTTTNKPRTKRTTHKHQNTEFGTKHVAHHINGTGMYKPDSKIRAQKSAVTSHMLRRLCTHPPRNQCCS